MTERQTTEPYETRFAGLVGAYTDVATTRPIDPLQVSRTAMSSPPVSRRSGWPGGGPLGRRIAGDRWAAAAVAAILVVVVAFAVQGRLSDTRVGQVPTPAPSETSSPPPSAGDPIPDVLRHAWQRPLPVAPGPDVYGSGFLSFTGNQLEYGRAPGADASRSAIAVAGADILVVTATGETQGCQPGAVATYRWAVDGKDTVVTLMPVVPDACPAREELLAGPWVRSDLPPNPGTTVGLAAGTYTTSAFDPFAGAGRPRRLSYTVPAGWETLGDEPDGYVLHHVADPAQGLPSKDLFIGVIAQPAIADFAPGQDCSTAVDAPGVGRGRDALVAAIRARPGVVSTPPVKVTVGGFAGLMLDLRLAPSWDMGCISPGGLVVGTQVLHGAGPGAGPIVGLGAEVPVRLILLDLGPDHSLAIVIFGVVPTPTASFEDQAAAAMPVIESFEFPRQPGPTS